MSTEIHTLPRKSRPRRVLVVEGHEVEARADKRVA